MPPWWWWWWWWRITRRRRRCCVVLVVLIGMLLGNHHLWDWEWSELTINPGVVSWFHLIQAFIDKVFTLSQNVLLKSLVEVFSFFPRGSAFWKSITRNFTFPFNDQHCFVHTYSYMKILHTHIIGWKRLHRGWEAGRYSKMSISITRDFFFIHAWLPIWWHVTDLERDV